MLFPVAACVRYDKAVQILINWMKTGHYYFGWSLKDYLMTTWSLLGLGVGDLQ